MAFATTFMWSRIKKALSYLEGRLPCPDRLTVTEVFEDRYRDVRGKYDLPAPVAAVILLIAYYREKRHPGKGD